MICPKCKQNTAREVHVVGRADSLTRQDGGGSGFVSGISCLCGYWWEPEFIPVMAMPPDVATPRWNPGFKSQAFFVVEKFFDSITGHRAAGTSWYTIAKLLAQVGYRCQEKTLAKYYGIEKGRRSSYGEAQEA